MQDICAGCMKFSISRIEGQCCLAAYERFVETPYLFQSVPAIAMRLGAIGFDSNGRIEAGNRFFEAFSKHENIAAVKVGLGQGGVERQCLAKRSKGIVQPLQPEQNVAVVELPVGILWVKLERFAKKTLRFHKITALRANEPQHRQNRKLSCVSAQNLAVK